MSQNNSILPPNASPLQKDLEAATSGRLSLLDTSPLRNLSNPDLCPPHILPWLAWAMSVDVWDNNWNDATKGAVIRQSVQVHKQKGTIGALRRALSAFGIADITIQEWFDYGGEPFMFRVFANLREGGHSLNELDLIRTTITQTKNLRSHLEKFLPVIETHSDTPKVAVAIGMRETTIIEPSDV